MKADGGVFTLSLDCEGLWGMADRREVVEGEAIHGASLASAYEYLVQTLDASGIQASAAFVSAFAVPHDALVASVPLVKDVAAQHPAWYRHVLPRLEDGSQAALDGWVGNRFWTALAEAGHEMAWHGATHLPLHDATPVAAVEAELRLASSLFGVLGRVPTSVVFPRNQVGHLGLLRRAGFDTYRRSRRTHRIPALLREWNVLDAGSAEVPVSEQGWYVSPAGFFLNWPSGPRALVPASVTVARWRSMLRHAATDGRHVHMWFHPHNLITAPRMRPVFSAIMSEVAALVRSGHLVNRTMGEARDFLTRGDEHDRPSGAT